MWVGRSFAPCLPSKKGQGFRLKRTASSGSPAARALALVCTSRSGPGLAVGSPVPTEAKANDKPLSHSSIQGWKQVSGKSWPWQTLAAPATGRVAWQLGSCVPHPQETCLEVTVPEEAACSTHPCPGERKQKDGKYNPRLFSGLVFQSLCC